MLRSPGNHEVVECHTVAEWNEHHFIPARETPTLRQYGQTLPHLDERDDTGPDSSRSAIRGEKPASAQRAITLSEP
jgi:hypothetical protein